jgi:hypothetical protein
MGENLNLFWKWMEEKHGALRDDDNLLNQLYDAYGNPIYFTDQMLIGYMIEYIRDHENMSMFNVIEGCNQNLFSKMCMTWQCKNIYQELEDIIKMIDKE